MGCSALAVGALIAFVQNLPPTSRIVFKCVDAGIPVAAREDGLAERSALADAKTRLLRRRQRFRERGC